MFQLAPVPYTNFYYLEMNRPATCMSMMLSLSFRRPFASRPPIDRLSSITCFTRSRVPGVTSGRLFKTGKTVGIESPSVAPMSAIVPDFEED